MCSLIYAYSKEVGVEVELMNNGDDCQVIMERKDLNRYCSRVEKWFEVYGYRMQVEPPAYEFEQLEFCQARPVIVDGHPSWCATFELACERIRCAWCLFSLFRCLVIGFGLLESVDCPSPKECQSCKVFTTCFTGQVETTVRDFSESW